jgi:uncharacterized membrane-anchored protein
MGLHKADAVRASEAKSGDKTPPGKSKPDKDPKKKKETVKEAKSPDEMTDEEFEASLNFQQGKITIKEGLATLSVPAGFRYLNPEQSELLLVHGWGNPPGTTTLGMLLPSAIGPLSDEGWGVIISYQDDGYIKDDDAESIDYADLLKQMQEDLGEENQERQQKGFEPLTLIGWAAAPRYDRASHKLYWAKELQFGDNDEHTLNYNVRILGRKGILVLNAVASIGQLSAIETSMQDVMAFVDFNDGNRYADFTPGVDKIAAYGIGALIAGKVLVKVGFFKLLLGFIVGAKKLAIPAFIALGALLRKLFKRKAPDETETNTES